MLISGWLEPVEEGKKKVCATALHAAALDPQNGPALAMAGWALAVIGDNAVGGAELARKALDLHPNSAYVRMQSAYALFFSGQIDAAMEQFEAALRFSPLDSRIYTTLIGIANCHLFAKRFPQAIDWAKRAIEKGPHFAVAYRTLTIAQAHYGRIDEARDACRRLIDHPRASISWTLKRPFGQPWMLDLFIQGLRLVGLPRVKTAEAIVSSRRSGVLTLDGRPKFRADTHHTGGLPERPGPSASFANFDVEEAPASQGPAKKIVINPKCALTS
jgi:adenylate cyclase